MKIKVVTVPLYCESCGGYFGRLDGADEIPEHPYCGECAPEQEEWE